MSFEAVLKYLPAFISDSLRPIAKQGVRSTLHSLIGLGTEHLTTFAHLQMQV